MHWVPAGSRSKSLLYNSAIDTGLAYAGSCSKSYCCRSRTVVSRIMYKNATVLASLSLSAHAYGHVYIYPPCRLSAKNRRHEELPPCLRLRLLWGYQPVAVQRMFNGRSSMRA